jgi:hypothetical protein
MDRLLAWYGEENYARQLARARRFWAGEGRCVVSVQSSHQAYRQTFKPEEILRRAPENLRHQATLPGLNLPSFFPDFGTVSTARYWGGRARFDSTGANIFVDPVASDLDQALSLAPLPPDHPRQDAALGLRLYRTVCEQLETDRLWLRTPDFQGPLNTAGLVLRQEEMLVAMHEAPEKLHAFLARVCDFLISYQRHLCHAAQGRVCGNIWPYTFLPCDLGAALTEDLMPLLSPMQYQEFGIPYLRRIEQALGPLHVHCCGQFGRHAANLKKAGLKLRALEFHHPFTTIEQLECLSSETVFIPYIALDKQDRFKTSREYYWRLLKETPAQFRYWFALMDDSAENLELARELWSEAT